MTRDTTLVSNFWFKVPAPLSDEECWPWRGNVDQRGYGKFTIERGWTVGAHRVAYELERGQIPAGMTLDHLCHSRDTTCTAADECAHRRCVNPDHLEPVSGAENTRRGGHARGSASRCRNGHVYDEANTYITAQGYRACRGCKREWQSRYMERKRNG